MQTATEPPAPPGALPSVDVADWAWSTGEVCRLCGGEVRLVYDDESLYVECTCGPALALA